MTLVVGEVIGGGVVKLERVRVICPACRQQVETVATDGRVKGYCAVEKQYVDLLAETQGVPERKPTTAETRAKLSDSAKKRWQDPEYRAKKCLAQKERWQDPEYRGTISAALTGKHPTPETRAKLSASLKRWWHNKKGVKRQKRGTGNYPSPPVGAPPLSLRADSPTSPTHIVSPPSLASISEGCNAFHRWPAPLDCDKTHQYYILDLRLGNPSQDNGFIVHVYTGKL